MIPEKLFKDIYMLLINNIFGDVRVNNGISLVTFLVSDEITKSTPEKSLVGEKRKRNAFFMKLAIWCVFWRKRLLWRAWKPRSRRPT